MIEEALPMNPPYQERDMPLPSPSRTGALRLVSLLALSCATVAAAQQSSARNVFWSASDLVQVAANPGTQSTPRAAADHPQVTTPKKPSTTHTRPHVEPELVAKNGYGEQPKLVRVSETQIGLRYALLLRDSDGHYNEVSPSTTFHSGDHLRLSVMANQPGYLYVIQQGSSGAWSSIYPGKHAGDDTAPTNQIEAGQVYEVPTGKASFRFNPPAGQEKLFLVLSRERIADLEGAINSLKEGGQPTAAPATPDSGASQGEALEASNHIPDAFVQNLTSRDLALVEEETVDQPQAASQSGEKAVYVVSKASYSKGESPRVVASVTLRHE